MAWLNSDDVYVPEAVGRVVEQFIVDAEAMVVCGACDITTVDGEFISRKPPHDFDPVPMIVHAGGVPGQPSVFLRHLVIAQVGGLDENLHNVMDWEFWIRLGLFYDPGCFRQIDQVLAKSRDWPGTKTAVFIDRRFKEKRSVFNRLLRNGPYVAQLQGLRRKSYSATYWKQAVMQYKAGRARDSRSNALHAWFLSPGAYSPPKMLRFLIKTLLPSRWIDTLKSVRANQDR